MPEEKNAYSIIKNMCEKHCFHIFAFKISYIINMKGKKCQSLLLNGKKVKNANSIKVLTLLI